METKDPDPHIDPDPKLFSQLNFFLKIKQVLDRQIFQTLDPGPQTFQALDPDPHEMEAGQHMSV